MNPLLTDWTTPYGLPPFDAITDDDFGPAVEADWKPFTAKLVQRSGAAVLPIFFPGQNSRW